MVAKAKRNEYGDCVYTESDVLELIYQDPEFDISKLQIETAEQYLTALKELGIDLPTVSIPIERKGGLREFDAEHISNWHMPKEYYELDVQNYLLERCGTDQERQRVEEEYKIFAEKGFTKVLQFLVYFIDTLRQHNIVWGVGRGSSVSSFCLFLIGVHKINPLLYNLDYREFLR
jgi:DNA polymerase III alpha subunit